MSVVDASDAFSAMRILVALATLIQALEDYVLRGEISSDGPRPWRVQRREVPRVLRRLFADSAGGDRALTFVLILRVCASLSLATTPRPIDAIVLMAGTWVWGLRWRGTFNGGSDAMTMVVLTGTLLGLIRPEWTFAGLAYVAFHLIASFFTAGLAKIRNPEWRRGRALATFLSDGTSIKLASRPALTLAWTTMAFELAFPLAALNSGLAVAFAATGLMFHVANAYAFGLNRFLFAWLAAYPALLAIAAR